jgi:hypothetical protein
MTEPMKLDAVLAELLDDLERRAGEAVEAA